jgi:tRNA(fMet)-specific endonuclease VapC
MYLLDTNVCIAIINGMPVGVGARFDAVMLKGIEVFVPAVCVFEIFYGVEKSSRREFNARQVETLLGGALRVLSFEDRDASRAGELRVVLERQGTPIGPYDTLIAGQALARGLVMVTHNVREFSRVPGLKLEDWQA